MCTILAFLHSIGSSEEAHKKFMNLYQGIFLRPQTSLPRIQPKSKMWVTIPLIFKKLYKLLISSHSAYHEIIPLKLAETFTK